MYVTTMYDILGKYKDGGDGDGSELDQVFYVFVTYSCVKLCTIYEYDKL